MSKPFLFTIIMFLAFCANSQNHEREEIEHKKHSLGIVISHAFISVGINAGSKEWLALPAWGLNYNYFFTPKWGVGFHNDMILEEFAIQTTDGAEIERDFPIASCLVVNYKPFRHFSFLLGGGMEFATHENYGLVRIGFEPYFELPKHYELSINLVYDFKLNAYNHWNFGLGVSKFF